MAWCRTYRYVPISNECSLYCLHEPEHLFVHFICRETERVLIEFGYLCLVSNDGRLWTRLRIFMFHKERGIFWLAEQLRTWMKVCWATSRVSWLNVAQTNAPKTVFVVVLRENQYSVDDSFIGLSSRESCRCMTGSFSDNVLNRFIYVKLKEFL